MPREARQITEKTGGRLVRKQWLLWERGEHARSPKAISTWTSKNPLLPHCRKDLTLSGFQPCHTPVGHERHRPARVRLSSVALQNLWLPVHRRRQKFSVRLGHPSGWQLSHQTGGNGCFIPPFLNDLRKRRDPTTAKVSFKSDVIHPMSLGTSASDAQLLKKTHSTLRILTYEASSLWGTPSPSHTPQPNWAAKPAVSCQASSCSIRPDAIGSSLTSLYPFGKSLLTHQDRCYRLSFVKVKG